LTSSMNMEGRQSSGGEGRKFKRRLEGDGGQLPTGGPLGSRR